MRSASLDTSLVRFLAVVLITNSHMDLLYPDSRFATGGGLGNALFFALSGYGLAWGAQNVNSRFGIWIVRRLLRIYPQVAIVSLIGGLIYNGIAWSSAGGLVNYFVWPTTYWFVAAIVVFYLPLYFILKFSSASVAVCIVISAASYVHFYLTALDLRQFAIEGEYFRWLFYFPVMLIGVLMARRNDLSTPRALDGLKLLLVVFSYFGLKILMSRGLFIQWQFVLHLLTAAFVLYCIRFFSNPALLQMVNCGKAFKWVVLLGGLSLEVYLVQRYWIRWLADSGVYVWHAVAVVWPLIFASAWLVSVLCGFVQRPLLKWFNERQQLASTSSMNKGRGL